MLVLATRSLVLADCRVVGAGGRGGAVGFRPPFCACCHISARQEHMGRAATDADPASQRRVGLSATAASFNGSDSRGLMERLCIAATLPHF